MMNQHKLLSFFVVVRLETSPPALKKRDWEKPRMRIIKATWIETAKPASIDYLSVSSVLTSMVEQISGVDSSTVHGCTGDLEMQHHLIKQLLDLLPASTLDRHCSCLGGAL
jgi:hypothetical protein